MVEDINDDFEVKKEVARRETPRFKKRRDNRRGGGQDNEIKMENLIFTG